MFLKNKNIIFKIRRSKVTDYAALRRVFICIFSLKNIHTKKMDSWATFKRLALFREIRGLPVGFLLLRYSV